MSKFKTFKSKLFLTTTILLLSFQTLFAQTFKDVPTTHPQHQNLQQFYNLNLIQLDRQNNFNPDQEISVGEFLELNFKYLNTTLPPVENSGKYQPYLTLAKNLKIATVSQQETDKISREDALKISMELFGISTPFQSNIQRSDVFVDTNLNSRNILYLKSAKTNQIFFDSSPRRFQGNKKLTKIEAIELISKTAQASKTQPQPQITTPTPLPQLSTIEQELLNNPKFKDFIRVYQIITSEHLKEINISKNDLLESAIKGMLSNLKDPHSVYDTTKHFDDMLSTEIEGIGIYLITSNNTLKIDEILPNSPASQAGLKVNDQIIKVDNIQITEKTLNNAINSIKGKSGTTVKITILRQNQTLEFEITRSKININSVRYKNLENNISYISINRFATTTTTEFEQALQNHLNTKNNKLIVDLRDNLGGYLYITQEILNHFLPKGEIAFKTQDSHNSIVEYTSFGPAELKNNKIIVLVNENTASASEVLAAAIKEKLNATLLGTQTYGKGSVQKIDELNSGFSLKISVAYWLTPNGINIDGIGLKPDIFKQLSYNDLAKGIDSQLNQAISELNKS